MPQGGIRARQSPYHKIGFLRLVSASQSVGQFKQIFSFLLTNPKDALSSRCSTGSGVGQEVLNSFSEATTLREYSNHASPMILSIETESRPPLNEKVELGTIIFGSSAVVAPLVHCDHRSGWHFTRTSAAVRSLSDRAQLSDPGWTVSRVHLHQHL